MKHKARNLIVLGWIALTACGCPSLWKYNYQEAYDEDPAYLSVPDPQDESDDSSSSEENN
jgi:hypothetical protein